MKHSLIYCGVLAAVPAIARQIPFISARDLGEDFQIQARDTGDLEHIIQQVRRSILPREDYLNLDARTFRGGISRRQLGNHAHKQAMHRRSGGNSLRTRDPELHIDTLLPRSGKGGGRGGGGSGGSPSSPRKEGSPGAKDAESAVQKGKVQQRIEMLNLKNKEEVPSPSRQPISRGKRLSIPQGFQSTSPISDSRAKSPGRGAKEAAEAIRLSRPSPESLTPGRQRGSQKLRSIRSGELLSESPLTGSPISSPSRQRSPTKQSARSGLGPDTASHPELSPGWKPPSPEQQSKPDLGDPPAS